MTSLLSRIHFQYLLWKGDKIMFNRHNYLLYTSTLHLNQMEQTSIESRALHLPTTWSNSALLIWVSLILTVSSCLTSPSRKPSFKNTHLPYQMLTICKHDTMSDVHESRWPQQQIRLSTRHEQTWTCNIRRGEMSAEQGATVSPFHVMWGMYVAT